MAYTDFLDLAQARYSVRKFLDKKVPKDIIEKFLRIKWWDWDIETIVSNMEDFYDPRKFVEKYFRENISE